MDKIVECELPVPRRAATWFGKTPLYLAAEAGETSTVLCVSSVTKLTLSVSPSEGDTPVHTAAGMGNLETLPSIARSRCIIRHG